jgi:hypothetical protein
VCAVLKFLRAYWKWGFLGFASIELIYRGMKYIKLFEAFSNYDLPNFRVNLLKPGMANSRYLFTCIDGSWNSFFGVFDLEGLKRLEDAMNTECVFAELENALQYENKEGENLAFGGEHVSIKVNKIPSDTKFINLVFRAFDIDFNKGRVTNKPAGMFIGKDGIGDEIIIHGHSVITSSVRMENDPDNEPIKEYPAELNVLYFEDHHWTTKGKTKNYREAFDELVGFGESFYGEWREYTLEDIQPFISSIIDAGAPDGFIKEIEGMKALPQIKKIVPPPPPPRDPSEIEFEKMFYKYVDELNSIFSRWEFPGLRIEGEVGSKERFDSLKEIRKEKLRRSKPLFDKIESHFKTWEKSLSPEYVEDQRGYVTSLRKSFEIFK